VEVAESQGVDIEGVRLDSGDLVALSKEVADVVGDADIFVSSGIDEYELKSFLSADGVASGFGPGTAHTTSADAPKVEAVYKLVAVEEGGELRPTMKLSPGKVTYPHQKSVRRVEREGEFVGDVLARRGEDADGDEQLVTVYEDGSLVYSKPTLDEIRRRTRSQVRKLPRKVRDPAEYPVRVSDGLESATATKRDELAARYVNDRSSDG
jgi:nicotinate phosphoribosyltransferase